MWLTPRQSMSAQPRTVRETGRPGVVCAMLTADCLPVFLCAIAKARKVALLHAGWRGLTAGVIEAGLRALATPGAELLAWFGPAIGPDSYEVGDDVRDASLAQDAGAAVCFHEQSAGRWFANLYALARRRLQVQGVNAIYGGNFCTLRERERFYSFRRAGCASVAKGTTPGMEEVEQRKEQLPIDAESDRPKTSLDDMASLIWLVR